VGVFQLRTFSDAFKEPERLKITIDTTAMEKGAVDTLPFTNGAGMTQAEAVEVQQDILASFKRRFRENGLLYDVNKWSGYINLRGVPYWDCHNLAYYHHAIEQLGSTQRSPHESETVVDALPLVTLSTSDRTSTLFLPNDYRTVVVPNAVLRIYESLRQQERQLEEVDERAVNAIAELGALSSIYYK